MNLLDIFSEKNLLLDFKARDKKGAFKEIIQHLAALGSITDDAGKKLEKAITKREDEGSTGIGKGLAIPHAKNCNFISEVIGVFARSKEGISFNSVDGGTVYLVFMVASPGTHSDKHLQIMRKIATLHKDDKTLKFLKTTENPGSVLEILKEVDEMFG